MVARMLWEHEAGVRFPVGGPLYSPIAQAEEHWFVTPNIGVRRSVGLPSFYPRVAQSI